MVEAVAVLLPNRVPEVAVEVVCIRVPEEAVVEVAEAAVRSHDAAAVEVESVADNNRHHHNNDDYGDLCRGRANIYP